MKATRIKATELDRRLSGAIARREASQSAEGILAEANATAERILEDARAAAKDEMARVSALSDAQLAEFVDHNRIETAADAGLRMMRDAARLTERFDALGPWISDLVADAVMRILGTIPDEDRARSIIALALSEGRADWQITLRSSPDSTASLRRALKDEQGEMRPEFAAVRDIVADDRLAPGTCLMLSADGAVDISIETQVAVLTDRIRRTDGRADDTAGPR